MEDFPTLQFELAEHGEHLVLWFWVLLVQIRVHGRTLAAAAAMAGFELSYVCWWYVFIREGSYAKEMERHSPVLCSSWSLQLFHANGYLGAGSRQYLHWAEADMELCCCHGFNWSLLIVGFFTHNCGIWLHGSWNWRMDHVQAVVCSWTDLANRQCHLCQQ